MLNNKDKFLEIIKTFKNIKNKENQLYKLGINIDEFSEDYLSIIDIFIDKSLNDIQTDLFYDYIYGGWNKVIYEEDGTDLLLDTDEKLYDYLLTLEVKNGI